MKSPYRDENHPLHHLYNEGCGHGYQDGISSWDQEEGQDPSSKWKGEEYSGEQRLAYEEGYDNGYANGSMEE